MNHEEVKCDRFHSADRISLFIYLDISTDILVTAESSEQNNKLTPHSTGLEDVFKILIKCGRTVYKK